MAKLKSCGAENQLEVGGGISVQEAGRRGGLRTAERGSEFFRKIGMKGGQRTAEVYGQLLAQFGRRGGRPRRPTLSESTGEQDQQ
jgi:general stress protein YciG